MTDDQSVHEIVALCNRGEDMTRNAQLVASESMSKLLDHFHTAGGRDAALRHYGVYMGIAAQLKHNVLPRAVDMTNELTPVMGSKKSAEVMADIWLAKVIKSIVEQVNQYNLHEDDK